MDKKLFDFTVNLETESDQSFLVLSKQNFTHDQLIEFQVEMIAQNMLPGIIPLEVREHNSEVKLIYNISGLSNLAEYLKSMKIEPIELLTLLERILSVIQEAKNYFLNENSLVINEKYIFVNPKSMAVSFVYLPYDTGQDLTRNFRAFVINLVSNTANIEDEGDSVRQILHLMRAEGFSLNEFSRQLKQLRAIMSTPDTDPGVEMLQYLPMDPVSGQEYITIVSPQKQHKGKIYHKRSSSSTGLLALGVIGLVAVLVTLISRIY